MTVSRREREAMRLLPGDSCGKVEVASRTSGANLRLLYGGTLRLSSPMSDAPTYTQLQRPLRADARRNYEKLVAAAREGFTEQGASASLEAVAERAGVGISPLYRRFPTR